MEKQDLAVAVALQSLSRTYLACDVDENKG